MSEEKRFLRQCCSCREYKQKNELIRLTRDYKTGHVDINNDNKYNGRSVYICKNKTCIETALKKQKIERLLDSTISGEVKEKLYDCTN